MPVTEILYADTNAFLQLRDLKDLPWQALFPGTEAIDVMVAPRVIEELDRHKTSTNQRRRDRARMALQLIETASREPDLALVLRNSPIQIRLVISAAPRFDWALHPNLDPAKPDDQLVAEALSFGTDAAIFSHDAGPRIRARIAKIRAHEPPVDWLLPIEQTDDQRRIGKLERELEEARSRYPKISAGFRATLANGNLPLIKPRLPPLANNLISQLVINYLNDHQRASLSSSPWYGMAFGPSGISERDIEDYNARYASFESAVRDYFANLHETVGRLGWAVGCPFFVKNESGVAAQGLRLEFDLKNGGLLLADREDAKQYIGSLGPPAAPKPPSSTLDIMHSIGRMPTIRDVMQPRDPIQFYWIERPEPPKTHGALQCEDFRATREFSREILVLSAKPSADKELCISVSAANLPAPVNFGAKLIISEENVEWSHSVVKTILSEGLRRRLSTVGAI